MAANADDHRRRIRKCNEPANATITDRHRSATTSRQPTAKPAGRGGPRERDVPKHTLPDRAHRRRTATDERSGAERTVPIRIDSLVLVHSARTPARGKKGATQGATQVKRGVLTRGFPSTHDTGLGRAALLHPVHAPRARTPCTHPVHARARTCTEWRAEPTLGEHGCQLSP